MVGAIKDNYLLPVGKERYSTFLKISIPLELTNLGNEYLKRGNGEKEEKVISFVNYCYDLISFYRL